MNAAAATMARAPGAVRANADDIAFMRQAIAFGRRGLGRTWPNPSVGALVVRGAPDGPIVVGRGRTADGGRPHAEQVALRQAGALAKGATLYVSLEPCARRSQSADTISCSDAIIAAGIARVIYGLEDPSPFVAGEGGRKLRAAGLEVEIGICAEEAADLHAGHLMRIREGRPFIELKLARTADGYAAKAERGPLAITGELVQRHVHMDRAQADAIMVGVGTVIADDPQLTCRLPGLEAWSPVKVVLDSNLRTPPTAKVVVSARNVPTWVIAAEDAPVEAERALLAQGTEVMRVGREPDGCLDLRAALELLGLRGITRVMSEGGPRLGAALAARDLVDEVTLFTADKTLAQPGYAAIQPSLAERLADPGLFKSDRTVQLGTDRMEHFVRLR